MALKLRADMATAQAERAEATAEQLAADDAALAGARAEAEAERDVAAARVAEADAAVREAAAGHRAATARAEALAMAVDEDRGKGDARRLAGVAGVVGTLLELVDVDAGYEAAFEAAVADSIGALVVDGVTSARRLLHDLAAAGAGEPTGLLVLGSAAPPTSPLPRRLPRTSRCDRWSGPPTPG